LLKKDTGSIPFNYVLGLFFGATFFWTKSPNEVLPHITSYSHCHFCALFDWLVKNEVL
jgi:hypothetical protein